MGGDGVAVKSALLLQRGHDALARDRLLRAAVARTTTVRPTPRNALSESERLAILTLCNRWGIA